MACVLGFVHDANGQEIPGWQLGQSSWTGSGYATGYVLPNATASRESVLPTSSESGSDTTPLAPAATNADAQMAYVGADLTPPPITPVAPSLPAPATIDSPMMALPDNFGLNPPTSGAAPAPTPARALVDPPSMEIEPIERSDDREPLPGQEITDAIASPIATLEPPPLEPEVVRWYQRPWMWIRSGWENHAEFGLDGSSGNADTLAIQTGLEMKRKTDFYTLAFDFDYRQASASNETTEDNGRLNIDYDRLVGDSPWAGFGKFGLEFDEFKNFDLRLNLNAGVGYHWIRSKPTNLVTRFGAGASKEFGAPDDDWVAEAVFGLEADHQLTARQKVKAKLDYFPAWEDFSNYRLVTDFSWETLLDSSDNLSLRLAVTDRYDSTPQGAEPNDFYYSVLLLYKF
ncbi:MAG: DUF481 domain-containing protein [Planctomycetota bacterium]